MPNLQTMPDLPALQALSLDAWMIWGGLALLVIVLVVLSWSFLRAVARTTVFVFGLLALLLGGVLVCESQGWVFESPVVLPRVRQAVQHVIKDLGESRQTAGLPGRSVAP